MNDLIDRQVIIEKMRNRKKLFCKNRIEFMALSKDEKARVDEIDNCIVDLVNTSSVKPERREKGEWIYDGIRGRFPACKCSICGHYENADWALLQGVNYCPNCGAEMTRGE